MTTGGCEFALCQRPAEMTVQTSRDVDAVAVCGLHVTPVLTWGVVLDDFPVIRYIDARPEGRERAA